MSLPKVLFVCVENSCRSQIAEAFAKIHGKGKVEAFSSGSKPSGQVNPKAVSSMKELGYDLTTHTSKSLDQIPKEAYAAAVTMGCGDACPFVQATIREDWGIPDPKHLPPEEFAKVRNLIEQKVLELVRRLKHTKTDAAAEK